jgi:putative transposase
MEGYKKSSHAVYRCEYHFVWVPKYRYQVLVKNTGRCVCMRNVLCRSV